MTDWPWLLVKGPGPSLHRTLPRAAHMPSQHGDWLPPEPVIQEEVKWYLWCLFWPSQVSPCPQYPMGHAGQRYPVWEGPAPGHEFREAIITGGVLGAIYHSGRCSQGGSHHACSEVGSFSVISACTLGNMCGCLIVHFPLHSSSMRVASKVHFSFVTNAVCKLPPCWVCNSQPLWGSHYICALS